MAKKDRLAIVKEILEMLEDTASQIDQAYEDAEESIGNLEDYFSEHPAIDRIQSEIEQYEYASEHLNDLRDALETIQGGDY